MVCTSTLERSFSFVSTGKERGIAFSPEFGVFSYTLRIFRYGRWIFENIFCGVRFLERILEEEAYIRDVIESIP